MFINNLFKRWSYKHFAPDLLQRESYEAFRRLLEYDRHCHELIADIQDLYFKNEPVEWIQVISLYNKLSMAVANLVQELPLVAGSETKDLSTYYKKFDSYIRFLLQVEHKSSAPPYVVWLNDVEAQPQLVGNKAANIVTIQQNLGDIVPFGFAVTTNSWHYLIEHNDLGPTIDALLLEIEPDNLNSVHRLSHELQELIVTARIPPELDDMLHQACEKQIHKHDGSHRLKFAVRSSGFNEDGQNSFAGQYRSIMNVLPENVGKAYLKVLASKYTPNALLYRITTGISDSEASMAVLIMEMVQARAAGVTYTVDPTTEYLNTILIHSVAGSGEKLVSGMEQPSISRFDRNKMTVLAACQEDTSPISANEAQLLALQAIELETLFGMPQDIEWAIGSDGPVILQSRPLHTILSPDNADQAGTISKHNLPLLYQRGVTGAQGQGAGTACFFSRMDNLQKLPAGTVLIVDDIPPSLIPLLPRCNAVVSMKGSAASHFATICREFEIPLIVGASEIKERVTDGETITVDATSRKIYRGYDKSGEIIQSGTYANRQLPYFRRLRIILDFIVPLNILDPDADSFHPDSCRSFHDIVRYTHEKGVQAMFAIGTHGGRRRHRKKLVTTLPFELYLIDVEEDSQKKQSADENITVEQVGSIPFQALWKGLSHHSIEWGDREYYNWKEYDNAAMTDGFAFKNKSDSASYAICSQDYLNLNIRFGYHFTIVDTLCSENSEQNYCSIRFSGGGGTEEGRYFRLQFLETILRNLGFKVTCKTDLLDARIELLTMQDMKSCLISIGRMLGTSKLMDMVLKDEQSVAHHLQRFFNYNDPIPD